jgi:hypothetical protein
MDRVGIRVSIWLGSYSSRLSVCASKRARSDLLTLRLRVVCVCFNGEVVAKMKMRCTQRNGTEQSGMVLNLRFSFSHADKVGDVSCDREKNATQLSWIYTHRPPSKLHSVQICKFP